MTPQANRAQFIGRLSDDATIEQLPSGERVARFSIPALLDNRILYLPCVAIHASLVDVLEKHGRKDRSVFLEGKLQTRSGLENGQSADHHATQLILDLGCRLSFLN